MTSDADEPTVVHALISDDGGGPTAREAYAFVMVAFGFFGVVALVVALMIGIGKSDGSSSASGGGAPTAVTLKEFSITPAAIQAVNGAGLDITNRGNVQHNLAVEGTASATAMIDPGQSAHLDLSMLPAGDYTVICQVVGHKEAGMTAKLHVTAGQGAQTAAAAGDPMAGMATSSSSMTSEQMDKAMKDSIGAFPAKTDGPRRAGAGSHGAARRDEAVRAHRGGHEVGGVTGQDGRRHDLQRHRAGPDHQGRPR